MEFLKSQIFHDAQNTKMVASGAYFVACLCSNSGRFLFFNDLFFHAIILY